MGRLRVKGTVVDVDVDRTLRELEEMRAFAMYAAGLPLGMPGNDVIYRARDLVIKFGLTSAAPDACEVVITQDDINDGSRRHASSCPVALALKRVFPDADKILAGITHAYTRTGDDAATWWYFPDSLSAWVRKFDAGGRVSPATFTIIRSRQS
jgi:hypothetical protein